jgi:murein endopeptidase
VKFLCGIALCTSLACAPLPNAAVRPQVATLTEVADPVVAADPQEPSPAQPASAQVEVPIEDDLPTGITAEAALPAAPHPLDGLSEEELRRRIREDLPALGSMSLGPPNNGALKNGVAMPEDPRWVVVDKSHAYGTQETVDALARVMSSVSAQFEDTKPLHIGHISGPNGGTLAPHLSHQTGRDVDLAYYYTNGATWYQRATAENLDVVRTWALVRALVVDTDVEFILIDSSIQTLLRAHAELAGEDPAWLLDLFRGTRGKNSPLIRHVKGHATHLHVRFRNPIAEETARRCYSLLVSEGKLKPPTYYTQHVAKKGDSLLKLAAQYGTTVKAIQRANGLRSSKIFAKKVYKIPRSGPASMGSSKVVIPARRLPPFTPKLLKPVPQNSEPPSPQQIEPQDTAQSRFGSEAGGIDSSEFGSED